MSNLQPNPPDEQGAPENGSVPVVLCVGGERRRRLFEENGFKAFAYSHLGSEPVFRKMASTDKPLSPARVNSDADYRLEPRLYALGLEGRRVVVLAPPYKGPRRGNPADRLAAELSGEGARVTIVEDVHNRYYEPRRVVGSGSTWEKVDGVTEYHDYDADDYEEPSELAAVEAVKAATQTYGTFHRKRAAGEKPKPLLEGVRFRGQNHIAFGGAGQGKTMLACYVSSEIVKRGEGVVYLDRENGPGRIFDRMRALGCADEELEERFYYFENPASTLEDAPDYREMLTELRPALVVFDSLFGFMTAAGLNEDHGPDVGKWADAYAPPTLEVATLILDHTPKQGDTERGSGRKRDAMDVSWLVKGNFSTDRVGPLTLQLKKSRDGGLAEKVAFTFGGSPLVAKRGDSRKLKPEELTLDALEDGMTAGEWLDAAHKKETTFFNHLRKLVKDGLVEKNGDCYFHVEVAES
jgi:hypothetical protein